MKISMATVTMPTMAYRMETSYCDLGPDVHLRIWRESPQVTVVAAKGPECDVTWRLGLDESISISPLERESRIADTRLSNPTETEDR